jgi:hypothetical protein
MGSGDCIFYFELFLKNKMKKHSKKILIYTTLKNNFMKINLYKALPILLISADLLIYVIDSEIQVARFLTVIALIILLTK